MRRIGDLAVISCSSAVPTRPLLAIGRFEDALRSIDAALRLEPDFAEALNVRGDTLRNLNRPEEAAAALRHALRLRPADPDTQVTLAFAMLQQGRFEEGWRLHEARWQARAWRRRGPDRRIPAWQGEALGGRTLLVHAEQGLGDTIMFARFVADLPAGPRVVLEVQPPLVDWLSGLERPSLVVPSGAVLDPVDLQVSLLSLPHLLRRVPDPAPYLSADLGRVVSWHAWLEDKPGLKVGIAWAGDPTMAANARRSLPLRDLAPVWDIPGVSFISLQKGAAAREADGFRFALHDAGSRLGTFADTAALIEALDLVIAVDTAVVHVAGALGRPVWLLNRFDRCWRWQDTGDGRPWYATLRQFRQSTPGDWASVVLTVRDALADRVRSA